MRRLKVRPGSEPPVIYDRDTGRDVFEWIGGSDEEDDEYTADLCGMVCAAPIVERVMIVHRWVLAAAVVVMIVIVAK